MTRPLASAVVCEEDVDWATFATRELARDLEFEALDSNLIAAAVSELAMNMVRHAGGGRFEAYPIAGGRGLEATFRDEGPGVADPERVFAEGYSTVDGSLGLGLGAARRAVEQFDLRSAAGDGTTITIRHFRGPPAERFGLGIVTMADHADPCNGDAVFHRTVGGDTQLLALIDARGGGPLAHEAAKAACRAMGACRSADPADLVVFAGRAMLDADAEDGFAIAALAADLKRIRIATVGDADCRVYRSGPAFERVCRSALPRSAGVAADGQISFEERRVDAAPAAQPLYAVLASDGVSPRYHLSGLERGSSAQDVAEHVFRNHRRHRGHATVAALRISG